MCGEREREEGGTGLRLEEEEEREEKRERENRSIEAGSLIKLYILCVRFIWSDLKKKREELI